MAVLTFILIAWWNPLASQVLVNLKNLQIDITKQVASVTQQTSTPNIVAADSLLQTTPGGWAKLKGTNLSNNIVISGATYQALQAQVLNGGQRVDFKIDPRENPGTYQIYLTSLYGRSNALSFKVLPRTAVPIDCSVTPNNTKDYYTKTSVKGIVSCVNPSACTEPSTVTDACANTTTLNKNYCSNGYRYAEVHTCPNGCNDGVCKWNPVPTSIPSLVAADSLLAVAPGGWAKLKGTNLTTNVVVEGLRFPLLSLQLLNGGQRVDFKVDPRERAGKYKIYVVNDAGQSSKLDFTVTVDLSGPAPIHSNSEALWRNYGTTSFYLLSGPKTQINTNIQNYADSIPAGATTHETVQNIMDWMHNTNNVNPESPTNPHNPINGPNSSNNYCNDADYLSKNADEILSMHCALDCNFWTTLFVALARAKGIPASALETVSDRWVVTSQAAGCMHGMVGHFVADVYTNNGWELADPTSGYYMSYYNSDHTASGYALMRFDAYAQGRPTQPLNDGFKYRIFRRGLDATDSGIITDAQRKQIVTQLYNMPGVDNFCGHEKDLYSVHATKAGAVDCNEGDIELGNLRYAFLNSSGNPQNYKLCKNPSASVSVYMKAGDNCKGSDHRAGIFLDYQGNHRALCFSGSSMDVKTPIDSSNCDSRYNQAGVFVGTDNHNYKICFRYIGT